MADFTKHTDTSSSHDHGTATTPSSLADHHSTAGMSMQMAFFTSSTTPLFSTHWTPHEPGHYAGTCLFLISLAITSRFLSAWKNILEQRWARVDAARDVVIASKSAGSEEDEDAPAVEAYLGWGTRPWRWSVDLPRSAMTVVTSGVGYLLMLAVMTMNVGYFLSVLAGIFMGELVCGRYIRS